MKKILCLTWIFLALGPPRAPNSLHALDIGEGFYGSLSGIYNADGNAGLTAFPVLLIPMGGRAEGMGTAFTAVADDLTFIEWNPAASSRLANTELGFFHNNWIADTKVEGIVYASRLENLENFGYGASAKWLYTPFSEYNMYGDRVSKGYYSEVVATVNVSYNFLAGYYFSGISLGANLKGAFRFMPDFTDADDRGNNQGQIISGSGRSQSAVTAMLDLGLLTRFNLFKTFSSREKNASVALVARNLGLAAKQEPLPASITAALAYRPIRPLVLDFDFTVPVNTQDLGLSEKPYWAFGANLNVTDFISMRAGLLGRYGAYRVTIGSAVDLGQISLDLNYSLDLLTQITPLNRISLGVRFNFGDRGRQEKSDRVDALYLSGMDSYKAGNVDQAKTYWEEALAINPRFDPAKEGLTLLAESSVLDNLILDSQTLDSYE
ncbi:MAG: UPF0164 family protein [Treponema sp.]|jgi:hypothetical protein|nr:UPF0164 family protein [Treponema sp.]